MQNSQTITLELLESVPVIMINCSARPQKDDILACFQTLNAYLQASEQSLFVVVDLRYNVFLPISDSVSGALNGVYLHPKNAACLIIGGNQTARAIVNILVRITHQNRFLWFKDEAEVCDYIKSKTATNGT